VIVICDDIPFVPNVLADYIIVSEDTDYAFFCAAWAVGCAFATCYKVWCRNDAYTGPFVGVGPTLHGAHKF
jgi:hypothetical protein